MASGWSAVRDEIRATLEAAPLSLRRVERGIADLAGLALSGASSELFNDGYFIQPVTMAIGPYMQILSTERALTFEIFLGYTVGSDYGNDLDTLLERAEVILQKMHDCNANVPSAKIVRSSGVVQLMSIQETPDQVYAILPFECVYRMP